MNKITKLTFMTAAMFLLSAQAVYAENAPAETTEATTVAPVENDADNHENEAGKEYFPKEEPFTGFTSRDGVTYYHVNNVPITSQWRKIEEKWYYFNEEGIMQKSAIVDGYLLQDTGEMAQNDTVKIGENTFYADENGRMVYEGEIYYNGQEYEFDIDAATGEIVKWKAETKSTPSYNNRSVNATQQVTPERAKSIALAQVSGANQSHVGKVDLDLDNGTPVYEIEIFYNNSKYEFDIDAITGEIVKWKVDRD